MNNLFLKLRLKMQSLIDGEEGQDLVEYALLITLISLGVVVVTTNLESAISTVFQNAINKLT